MPVPEPSEWGKLNAGQHFQVIALDVKRALFHAGLNTYEAMLVDVVMEQSWYTSVRLKGPNDDWPEPLPAKVNISEFARLVVGKAAPDDVFTKLRKRLYEARKSLVDSHILIEDGEGFWINKNANEWTTPDGESPRLGPGSLDYCLSARSRKVSENSDKAYPEKRTNACTLYPEKRVHVSGNPDKFARKNGQVCPEKRTSAYKAPARRDPEEKEEIRKTPPDGGGGGVADDDPPPTREILEPDPAAVDALSAKLDAMAPGLYWGPKVRQFAPMYPLGWIEEAASIALARGKGWNFVDGILRRYQREGGPDRGPAVVPMRATGTGIGPRRRGPDIDNMPLED